MLVKGVFYRARMKTITQISMQKNIVKHCNIYLDGAFYCGLRLETVVERRLKTGMEISEKELDEIQISSLYTHALDRAMELLSKSVKTEKQVRDYLAKKGFTQSLTDKVIDKLKEYRFINDELYAENYAECYSDKKGKYLIFRELKQKGVSEDVIKEALKDVKDSERTALEIAEKFLKGKPRDNKNLSACYRKLLSKGFGYDTCSEVMEKIKSMEED